MYTRNKASQDSITPNQAIEFLKEGNKRFVNNLKMNRNLLQQVNATKDGQHPFAVILSCIDSRTSAELIFDQGLGDIFSIRIAGNIVNEDILGSMEFACKIAGAKAIVVLGHTSCGAVKGACSHAEMGHLTGLVNKIKPAVINIEKTLPNANEDKVDLVATENVYLMVNEITSRSPILKSLIDENKIGIIGGMYNVETGVVNFFDEVNQKETLQPAFATAD
jgi:carbonic anhydrase